ncbi:CHAP domain-containing protein [Spirillospora sp. CA-253888]
MTAILTAKHNIAKRAAAGALLSASALSGLAALAGTAHAESRPAAPQAANAAAGAAQQVVNTAMSHVGEGQAADGTSYFGKWYEKETRQKGFAGAAWCDMFLTWASTKHGQAKNTGQFAYTPWHANWFKKQNRFDRTPRVGDYVFFDWNGGRAISGIDHVGMVTKVNKNGTFNTVEGNIGDKVVARKHKLTKVVGFGHPNYGA